MPETGDTDGAALNQEERVPTELSENEQEGGSASAGEKLRDPRYPLKVKYAPCGLPPEYCEFHSQDELRQCLPWLATHFPHWFESRDQERSIDPQKQTRTSAPLPPEQRSEGLEEIRVDFSAFADAFAELRVTAKTNAVNKPDRKESTKHSGGKQEGSKIDNVIIHVSKVKGNKQMTAVHGLEAFLERGTIKDMAKLCKKRFSCGATITRTEAHGEALEIQGDRSTDIAEWLRDEFLVPADRIFFATTGDLRNKQAAFPA